MIAKSVYSFFLAERSYLFCIPLVSLGPLGYFFGAYARGLGLLNWNVGFLISAFSMLLVPLVVSTIIAILCKTGWIRRILIFAVALSIQECCFLFHVVPPAATSELMGITHRLQNEFSVYQLHDCSNELLQKFHGGVLKHVSRGNDNYFPIVDSAIIVDDSDLPISIRGHFQRVFIQPDPFTGDYVVIYAVDHETGIIFGNELRLPEYAYPMGDGLETYHYEP